MDSGGRAGLQQAAGGGARGGGWVLVEARLQGGAPWGFTVQGGLEHDEPLIISKVEEGGKADSLEQPLLVGDEIIIINDVELSGYRQEAVALVKGSYKTLQLTVRREFDPTSRPSVPAHPPPSPPPLSSLSPSPQQQTSTSSHYSRSSAGGVQLRIKNRRSEPSSRPHSWHSTKLCEGQQVVNPGAMDTMSSGWHHSYHPSASTTDLSSGFDSGTYLRKSPDQYSSRGSMESLDHPVSSHHHSGAQHHHPLGHHSHSGSHATYSSCHQLSSARSSNSIDHLHSKRDSAYSSFSTSSSIPEYLASTPSFSPERSYSLETISQRGGGSGEMQQADIRYVRTVYDAQQGLSQEQELSSNSTALLRNSDSRSGGGTSRDLQAGGVCFRGSSSGSSSSGSSSSSVPASNRHSVGPIWGPAASCSSYESLKAVPAPPRRSDSYAAIRNHERPNSWSSLEHARSLRSLQKGSWHHSSGPVASGAAKGSYGTEGQLHTVIEKSPESSPTTKPRQGGGFPQPHSPTAISSGPAGPTAQSGRFILPTGKYPVPQPEPHYTQIPSTSQPGPGSSGVYPALAKESSRQQHQGLQGMKGREEGMLHGQRGGRTSATENGYHKNTSSTQLRTQTQEADRPQQENPNFGLYTPHMKTAAAGSEGQTGNQRTQNHQDHHNQTFQGHHGHSNQGARSQVFQEQNQDFHNHHFHLNSGHRPASSQEWRDPYTPVQSRGDRSRSMDNSSIYSEPEMSSMVTQGQASTHLHVHAPPSSASQPSSRHLSESSALQYQHWDNREQDRDREHPLTRLEIALAEVQQSPSPNSIASEGSHGSNSFSNVNQGPTCSLSVLEKVSRFERRERAGKQRSHSTTNAHNKAAQRMTEKGHAAACGADDLRNMLERSTSGAKAHRTLSYRGGSSEHMKYRTQADPSLALQRSRSSLQLKESREDDDSKDLPWAQDIQEILGPMQDTSFNRSYRDSLKDAQSKVLRSTSFRRRDLSSSISPPPAAPPSVSSSSNHQPPSIPAKLHSLEKKGPKTMPKPQGIFITSQLPPPVTSPHTPKERHVVSPEVRGPSPPTLPSVPPVGPPALLRICGRKRLAADQKKRSYSEPENLNEVGVSDPETAALFRRGGETSVADRRKMFELAASRATDGALQIVPSRTDLRQLQHDALAEYVERKRGVKRDEGAQKNGSRPRSAYLPENSNHTVSHYRSDTTSLSSTSSLLSLQDSGTDQNFSSGERSLCSTLPPGADLRSFESNVFYPGRVTTTRPPVHSQPSAPSGSPSELQAQVLQDLTPEAELSRQSESSRRDPSPGHQQPASEPHQNLGLSKQLNSALQRAQSTRGSRRSASAEDLLERSEEKQIPPQHYRSRSSPTGDRLNKDFPPGDIRAFSASISEPGRRFLAQDRLEDIQASGDLICLQNSQNIPNTIQPAGSLQDTGSSHTPVTRRDRTRRNSERPRTNSTLAASVGLPCPFSPSGAQDADSTEWHASERLSQANFDAIFPCIPQSGTGDGASATDPNEPLVTNRQARQSLSASNNLEDTAKDMHQVRVFSLDMKGEENGKRHAPVTPTAVPHYQPTSPTNRKESGSTGSSPPPSSHSAIYWHLPSLRISETSLSSSNDPPQPLQTGPWQEDYDEVFLQNPTPLSLHLPIQETRIMEELPPPPPPPVELDEPGQQTVERKSSLPSPPMSPSASIFPSPVPSLLPSVKPQPSTVSSTITSNTTEDSLGLDYQPLPKREKTSEELRVETLARQLVLQDTSLAPILEVYGGKSTLELMEEIFTSSKMVGKSPWQHRGSSRLDDRIQDGVCDAAQSTTVQLKETNLDADEKKDINTKKVELCEALRHSVAALRQEKDALREEQRQQQALGTSIDSLVQERLKANERDKYSVFIGDLEKIVNLLLSLCSRLSRIDRSLLTLERGELTQEGVTEERDSLLHKRTLLLGQADDARELKENLDRRQRVVHVILSGYLTESQLQDYRRFVSTKPSLLIRQRHLDNLIRQGEEQLMRLAESLPQELAEAHGWSRLCPFTSPSPAPCSSSFPPSVIPGPAHTVRSTAVTSL